MPNSGRLPTIYESILSQNILLHRNAYIYIANGYMAVSDSTRPLSARRVNNKNTRWCWLAAKQWKATTRLWSTRKNIILQPIGRSSSRSSSSHIHCNDVWNFEFIINNRRLTFFLFQMKSHFLYLQNYTISSLKLIQKMTIFLLDNFIKCFNLYMFFPKILSIELTKFDLFHRM